MAAEMSAQSPATNSLDQPAQSTGGIRPWNRSIRRTTPAPARNSDGRDLEVTTAPKVGQDPWGVRQRVYSSYSDPGRPTQWVSFYKMEKPAALALGSVAPKGETLMPTSNRPWSMTREDSRALVQHLYKFTEWSEVADKNRVTEVHKEIGQLRRGIEAVWFHRDTATASKSWFVVTETATNQTKYRLSATDVGALVELCNKLPGLDDRQLGRDTPPPPPSKPTDSLFK